MKPLSVLALSVFASLSVVAAAQAADLWRPAHARPIIYVQPVVYGPAEPPCYWCVRDAIYVDTKLIAHLEANPDVDDVDKAPWVLGARADVHYPAPHSRAGRDCPRRAVLLLAQAALCEMSCGRISRAFVMPRE